MNKITEKISYILDEGVHGITEQIDLPVVMAHISAYIVYISTFFFDFGSSMKIPQLGTVVLLDEITTGVIRALFAIITALGVLVLTDKYKELKEKRERRKAEKNLD